jgi:benzylsuccinate CoA-transferase BbsF subunit
MLSELRRLEMLKGLPMEGVKVLDFSWVIMGPLAAKWLGDLGATVVKVESMRRLDINRTIQPMKDGVRGVNRCGQFATFNSSKYGITLNLSHPLGIEVAKRFVSWADVVIENFVPGTMERLGLAYEDLKRINPRIIMVRGSLFGETGPHAKQRGFGIFAQAATGFNNLVGWPDRPPGGLGVAVTDTIGACYMFIAIMAALSYRRRTGEGQCIDVSQMEAGVSFLAPSILDYAANGHAQNPVGNRSPYAAPHGAYPCQGDDAWCAIAVFSDVEWRAFCQAVGEPEWTKSAKFATLSGRKENEGQLDRLVSEWTMQYTTKEVMTRLQAAGVAAGVVQNGKDLLSDPQLEHRRHLRGLLHPEIGTYASEAPAFKLSKSSTGPTMPAPCLGEHNEYVYTKILGMSDAEFIDLVSKGVFE